MSVDENMEHDSDTVSLAALEITDQSADSNVTDKLVIDAGALRAEGFLAP
jgi:hypothetical protein